MYFCDRKIISGMKKLGIIMAILLHVIVGFAQRSITVGAKIETDFQIWYLDSIVLSNDSTTLKWHVVSKGNTYACMSFFSLGQSWHDERISYETCLGHCNGTR